MKGKNSNMDKYDNGEQIVRLILFYIAYIVSVIQFFSIKFLL